jgi:hypothetical protein
MFKIARKLNFNPKLVNHSVCLLTSSGLPSSPSSNNEIKKFKENISSSLQVVDEQFKTEDTHKSPPKTPFKYYFEDEERDKNKIIFYENFFDKNTQKKDRENFMVSLFILDGHNNFFLKIILLLRVQLWLSNKQIQVKIYILISFTEL